MPNAALKSGHRVYLILSAWLVIVFLFGGGSRSDIASLLMLRPAAVLLLAYAICGLTMDQIRANRYLLSLAAGSLAVVLIHLIPLPPELWQRLPGREFIAEIDRQAGLGKVWRPLTMAPAGTRNALWSLMIPLSTLILGLQLDTGQRARLLPVILSLGLLSAMLAIFQLLGDPEGPLFFYRITNNGSAVGLFANRNHQAVFLATVLPMLVAAATLWQANVQGRHSNQALLLTLIAGGIVVLLPLILVTGSRFGLLAMLIAALGSAVIWPRGRLRQTGERTRGNPALKIFVPGLLILLVALSALTVLLGRGIAFDRLLVSDTAGEVRLAVLPTLLPLIRRYFWSGTGFGSFDQVWRVHEPRSLLSPFYLNHAHDDWLELILTGGVPALVLLISAMVGFCVMARRLAAPAHGDRNAVLLGRTGLLIILLLALASLFDYPLRVPSLSCLAVVAALWASAPSRGESN